MVSISNLLTLGLIAGGALAFIKLGGASGIGSRVGGGFNDLFSSFTGGLIGGDSKEPTYDPAIHGSLPVEEAIFNASQKMGRPLTPDENLQVRQKWDVEHGTDPRSTPAIATAFQPALVSGAISQDFAQRFSFQPPGKVGQLDVSKTFEYISGGGSNSVKNMNERNASNWGGYGSSVAQNKALASAIQASSIKFPEYFA